MRIDQVLERNQIRRDMAKRFKAIFWAFSSKELENPVTRASYEDAIKNIRTELTKSFRKS